MSVVCLVRSRVTALRVFLAAEARITLWGWHIAGILMVGFPTATAAENSSTQAGI